MENVLKIKGLNKRYGKQLALHDVDLTIAKGDIYGLVGLSLIHISEPTRPY